MRVLSRGDVGPKFETPGLDVILKFIIHFNCIAFFNAQKKKKEKRLLWKTEDFWFCVVFKMYSLEKVLSSAVINNFP